MKDADGTGLRRWRARLARVVGRVQRAPRPGLRVLLYHAVGSRVPRDTYGMSVSLQAFEVQMRWLRESGYAIVPLDEGQRDLAGLGRGRTAVAVTFDDGFRDVLDTAGLVLARYRIPFSVFVVGRFLDHPPERHLYLDRSALRDLLAVPQASVGAHGFTHRPLSRLESAALDDELRRSRDVLQHCTGTAVTGMSYPHGAVNRLVVERAAAAGFSVAGTSIIGVNRSRVHPLRLRRTEITAADSVDEFIGKVRGYYDWDGIRQRAYWPLPPA